MRCNVIRIIEKGADTVRGDVSRFKLVLIKFSGNVIKVQGSR